MSSVSPPRVLQVLVAVIIALVFLLASYIASPGKTTTEHIHEIFTSTVTETTTIIETTLSTVKETTTTYRDINVTVTPIYSSG